MCSRTQENNKNKVGPVIWDTLYISTYLHLHLRDRYINELAYYNKIGVGRTPAKFEESFFEFKTEKFL